MSVSRLNEQKVSDEELMARICSGQVPAFDELYHRYSKRLMGYFLRMMNFDRSAAEDALQDLFCKLAADPLKFDGSRTFKTWIFSVAANTCKNYYRHRQVVLNSVPELKTHLAEDSHFAACAARV